MTEALEHEELSRIAGPVSRETFQRLQHFGAMALKWTARTNLVSATDQAHIWRRHILDSAQLWPLVQNGRFAPKWVDLGSGGGFPGLVIAILMKETGSGVLSLVESNTKKVAFLRAAIAELSLPASVVSDRIENACIDVEQPDIVSARALAPLHVLLDLSFVLLKGRTRALFHKGRDYQSEIANCSAAWTFDVVTHVSKIDPASVVLDISNLRRR